MIIRKLINQLENKDIGCQYDIDDENEILFKYQSEEFKIILFSLIICLGFDIDDIGVYNFKLDVNNTNENSGITKIYNKRRKYMCYTLSR